MLILIADDDSAIAHGISQVLSPRHEVEVFDNGSAALKAVQAKSFDIAIVDNRMPGLTGLELLRQAKEISPTTTFLLMTAHGSFAQSLEAIQLGVDDYLMKPFDLREIVQRVQRIEDLRTWNAENRLKEEQIHGIHRLVGASEDVASAKRFILQVAAADAPVLVQGPTGSGKEVVAKAIHESGPRALRPF